MEIIKGDSPLPCLAHGRSHHRIPAQSPASQRRRVLCHGVVHGRLSIFAIVPVDQPYWAQASVVSLITSWGMHTCQPPSVSHHMPTDFVNRNMSFACGTFILSHSMHRHHQGLTASLVATTVICSSLLGSWGCRYGGNTCQ